MPIYDPDPYCDSIILIAVPIPFARIVTSVHEPLFNLTLITYSRILLFLIKLMLGYYTAIFYNVKQVMFFYISLTSWNIFQMPF